MKTLFLLLIAFSAYSQVEFEESMNGDLFQKINKERVKRNLPELTYYFVMQNTLDQVAELIKTKMCHCYGDTYKDEVLYEATSVDAVVEDLNKKSPLMKKGITMITIGVSDTEESYYYAIRTY